MIARETARSNRNLLLAAAALALAAALLFQLNARALYNLAFGPFALDRGALLARREREAPWRFFVTVPADDAYDTGIRTGSFAPAPACSC